eukprot:scaffold57899_cov18-Tisochrysis_lutea.AAC.2
MPFHSCQALPQLPFLTILCTSCGLQDRDRQRFISLEDSQNPTSFKRDPEAPLQPRIPPPRPPSQPPPMASLVSPGLPVTADAAAAAAAAGFPAGMLLPEAMMLGGGLVAESHLRSALLPQVLAIMRGQAEGWGCRWPSLPSQSVCAKMMCLHRVCLLPVDKYDYLLARARFLYSPALFALVLQAPPDATASAPAASPAASAAAATTPAATAPAATGPSPCPLTGRSSCCCCRAGCKQGLTARRQHHDGGPAATGACAALQQHELAVRQMQQRRQQEQQQYQQEPHMQPQQQQQQQQQQPPQAQLQAGAQVQQPSIEATTAVAGGGATAAPEDGALDERCAIIMAQACTNHAYACMCVCVCMCERACTCVASG